MSVKRKQKIALGISLLLIAILLAGSAYVYIEYYSTKKVTLVKQIPQTIIDNRISPLENQGLVLEILRIRDRDLLQKLITPGDSWKTKPSFYYITNIDGLEYISKDVQQQFGKAEILFNTWDSMFQENKVMKDVAEEQEKSQVTLTIMERVKVGLLGRRTEDVERDSLTVTYDFRTGRWSGSDNFKDKDGYGYYLGDTFEIWFNIYQIDYDGDYIPYWTEVNILHTDPTRDDSKLDPDGDGIPTAWEWRWGYDPFTWDDHAKLDPDLDGIENIEEYQMSEWFADPYIQDMYIEVDVMGRGGVLDPPHYLYEESQQGIIERFAQHNIKVFFDTGWPNSPKHGGGDILPHIDLISQDSGTILQFYDTYFPVERRGIFRYVVIGHGGGFSHPSKNNVYDTIQISYLSGKFQLLQQIKLFFFLGRWPTERGARVSLGGTLLHELAHSCSVDADNTGFGGIDNASYGNPVFPKKSYVQTWGQYRSVLNYLYTHNPSVFDLSSGKNGPPYDENDWGFIYPGFFEFNSNLIEEPYYTPKAGETIVRNEQPNVSGYVYDRNLTEKFNMSIKDWSPIDPIKVNWSVYRLVDRALFPKDKEIKIFVQPKIRTTQIWELYEEGYVDAQGNMRFYSLDELIKEAMK
jgi:hypothetical protein